jgi:putative DNA primase/helicase
MNADPSGRIDVLLARLDGVHRSGNGYVAKCPAHPDRTPSLSVREHDGTPLFHCHAGCDPESILAALGLSWSDLLAEGSTASRYTWQQHAVAAENDGAHLDAAEKKKRCNRIWSECVTLDDAKAAPVREYLTARIHPTILSRIDRRVMRCHPMLEHYDSISGHAGAWAAMVCLVQAPNGDPVGLHRTWLDGVGKAPVATPRKSLSAGRSMSGAAIRLMKTDRVLAVSEGIETGLALTHLCGFPVWACMSAVLMTHIQIPERIREVRIAVDMDVSGTGQNAALTLVERLRHTKSVYFEWPTCDLELIANKAVPSKSFDWADVVKE